jgi:hypothetical protein
MVWVATTGPDPISRDAIPLGMPAFGEADALEAGLAALDDANLWRLARRCATQVKKRVKQGHKIHSMSYCKKIIESWVIR